MEEMSGEGEGGNHETHEIHEKAMQILSSANICAICG